MNDAAAEARSETVTAKGQATGKKARTLPPAEREGPAPATKRGNPARKPALLIVAGLALLAAWYALSDRLAPSTGRGAVVGYVTQIAPRVSGQVAEVFAEDNAVVEEGEPLFALDPQPFEIAARQAEVGLAQAAQAIDASSAQLVSSQAQVAQARTNLANVQASTDRTLQLFERGVVADAQADAARAELANAQAQLDAAEAQLRSAEVELGGEGEENLQIQAAQLQLEQAQLNRIYATVEAPHRGVVTNVQLVVGQYVPAGQPAITFIDARGAWIAADLRENQLVNVDPGDEAAVLFDGVPGEVFEGRVESVAWGIDPGRATAGGLVQNVPETRWFEPARRFPVRVELPGGVEEWPQNVRVGSKVTVLIYAEGQDNPMAWAAAGLLRLKALLSYFY